MVDRLKQFKTELPGGTAVTASNASSAGEAGFDYEPGIWQASSARYDSVKSSLKRIAGNSTRLSALIDAEIKLSTPEQRKKNADDMHAVINETKMLRVGVKKILDQITKQDVQFAEEKTSDGALTNPPDVIQMRANLLNFHSRAFLETLREFDAMQSRTLAALRARESREVSNLYPGWSQEQVAKVVEDGRVQEVVQKAVMGEGVTELVNDVRQRHEQIKQLERDVTELFTLMQDLATLVDLQGEKIEVIIMHVDNAKEHYREATKVLKEAEKYQQSARSWKNIAMIVLVVILIIIVGIVSGFSLKKKGDY
jgi:t-SNARE complex subunit (syntaxin)